MENERSNFIAFVFPPQLEIIASNPATHKQILTLYNPYHFAIKFRIKCTNPKNYSVIEPHGVLKALCTVDIIIRHAAAQLRTSLGVDTFRIEVCPVHNEKLLGITDIPVRIMAAAKSEEKPCIHQSFHPQTNTSHPFHNANRHFSESLPYGQTNFELNSTSLWLCISIAVICATALTLPTQGLDVSTVVPDWLYLSVPQKLVFAYILGVLTLLILRPC